jgi:hypothetical protein
MTFTAGPGTVRLIGASAQGNPTLPISATWNNAATTFTGIRFDVTNTASAAGSLLMDLRIGGVSRFTIEKGGAATGSVLRFSTSGQITGNQLIGIQIGWANNFLSQDENGTRFFVTGVGGAYLIADGTETLAQRNGVNAQAFRIYNTFTDASNYERGFVRWNANVLQIGAEAAGTGLLRTVQVGSIADNRYFEASVGNHAALYSGGSRLTFNSYYLGVGVAAGAPDAGFSRTTAAVMRVCGSSGANAGALEFLEQAAPAAPAANSVRIYAVDNGSGKTQLMALFATGAAQQIAIEP